MQPVQSVITLSPSEFWASANRDTYSLRWFGDMGVIVVRYCQLRVHVKYKEVGQRFKGTTGKEDSGSKDQGT